MPEFLRHAFRGDAEVALDDLFLRMGMAFVLGCLVAGVYRLTHDKRTNQAGELLATLVMLTVLIAMVTMVIGSDLARAFGLVGALAIIRFRTVVEDTRDTAFVICAVAVGMAVGSRYLAIPLTGIAVTALAALLFRPRKDLAIATLDFTLKLRVGLGRDPELILRDTFTKHLDRAVLTSIATARQGAALDLGYSVRLRQADSALALVSELNTIESVQDVELRR